MMVCEVPPRWGVHKGQSVRGTTTGRDRHHRAGEPPCDECRDADNARRKAAYQANLDRELAVRKSGYDSNPEPAKARAAAWYRRIKAEQPLWVVWRSIKQRCLDPNTAHYPNYGGRGITICDRWLTFAEFVSDIEAIIGPRPPDPEGWKSARPYYSIDRIDNDGNYEPGNVRWATPKEQAANRRESTRW